MPKHIKGNAGRKPPEPTTDHSPIDAWFDTNLMPRLVPIVTAVDEAIRATVPDVHYAVFRKRAYYGTLNLGWLIEIAPYDVSVNVVFFGGAEFMPPPRLGSADRTRYVKVTSLDEAQDPQLLDWFKQSATIRGWQ